MMDWKMLAKAAGKHLLTSGGQQQQMQMPERRPMPKPMAQGPDFTQRLQQMNQMTPQARFGDFTQRRPF